MHSPENDDYIGVESCADLKSDVVDTTCLHGGGSNRRRRKGVHAAEKAYPPPISSLSHVPWVMKKYYSGDGRLVIREERVKRHEYFQAHRSNGRLVLNLIPLEGGGAAEERSEEINAVTEFDGDEINGGDEGNIPDPTAEETVSERCKYRAVMGVNPCAGFASAHVAAAAFGPPLHT